MANACTAGADIMANALTASLATNGDPPAYAEAMDTPQKMQWEAAIREECTSILRNNTFAERKSMPIPHSRTKPIGSKWVFKTKTNPDGSIRYKARLVIKGYM